MDLKQKNNNVTMYSQQYIPFGRLNAWRGSSI
jgi:hypothetical protein